MSHTMGKIIKAKLRDKVEYSKQQYGFMPGKGTTDAIVSLNNVDGSYIVYS